MKTPREILLERHKTAGPKLDAIRREIISAEMKDAGQVSRLSPSAKMKKSAPGATPVLHLLWRELIWPSRRIWAGLAVVWILLLAVNFSLRDRSPASAMVSASPEMILSFQQQERVLAELIGPTETRVSRPPKLSVPRPSSERQFEISTV